MFLVPVAETASKQSERAKPRCKSCNQPMKGHKNVLDCPKKQKELKFELSIQAISNNSTLASCNFPISVHFFQFYGLNSMLTY